MKPNETGTDPVAMLYGRFIGDLFTLLDVERDCRLILPAIAEGQEYTAKDCWGLFDSMISNYRWALGHFDESVKIHREATQQPDVAELIGRTRATQRRRPYIDDAKNYLDRSRNLFLRLLEELTSNIPKKKTVKAYYVKEDQCKAIFTRFGFTFEEIKAIPGLVEDLRNEFALIAVDRKPTFTAIPQDKRKEDKKPKSQGRRGARVKAWSELGSAVWDLKTQGNTPLEIRDKLKPKHPTLTTTEVARTIDSLRKRTNRANERKGKPSK